MVRLQWFIFIFAFEQQKNSLYQSYFDKAQFFNILFLIMAFLNHNCYCTKNFIYKIFFMIFFIILFSVIWRKTYLSRFLNIKNYKQR